MDLDSFTKNWISINSILKLSTQVSVEKQLPFFLKKNKRGPKTYLQYMTLHLLLL